MGAAGFRLVQCYCMQQAAGQLPDQHTHLLGFHYCVFALDIQDLRSSACRPGTLSKYMPMCRAWAQRRRTAAAIVPSIPARVRRRARGAHTQAPAARCWPHCAACPSRPHTPGPAACSAPATTLTWLMGHIVRRKLILQENMCISTVCPLCFPACNQGQRHRVILRGLSFR